MLGRLLLLILAACSSGCLFGAVSKPPDLSGVTDDTLLFNPSDPTHPFVVEWTYKTRLPTFGNRDNRIVMVEFRNGKLTPIDCHGRVDREGYVYRNLQPEVKSVQVANKNALDGHVGAVGQGASAGLANEQHLELTYVRIGVIEAPGTPTEFTGAECSRATHFVRGIDVGAYRATRGAAGSVGGSVNVGGKGASGSHNEAQELSASSGDVSKCKDPTLNVAEVNAFCGAPIRLDLQGISRGVSEASNAAPQGARVGIERNSLKSSLATYSSIALIGGATLGAAGYLYALSKHNDASPGSAKPISYALAITGDVGMGTGLIAAIVARFLPDYREVSLAPTPIQHGMGATVGGRF